MVPRQVILSPEQMVAHYESLGGRITDEWPRGVDPLANYPHLQEVRESEFAAQFNVTFADIFSDIVNNMDHSFKQAISVYVDVTTNLTPIGVGGM